MMIKRIGACWRLRPDARGCPPVRTGDPQPIRKKALRLNAALYALNGVAAFLAAVAHATFFESWDPAS